MIVWRAEETTGDRELWPTIHTAVSISMPTGFCEPLKPVACPDESLLRRATEHRAVVPSTARQLPFACPCISHQWSERAMSRSCEQIDSRCLASLNPLAVVSTASGPHHQVKAILGQRSSVLGSGRLLARYRARESSRWELLFPRPKPREPVRLFSPDLPHRGGESRVWRRCS
jgi:hypothetical protein